MGSDLEKRKIQQKQKLTNIFPETATEPLPAVSLDETLKRTSQHLGIQHIVEHERDSHVVPLDQQAVLKEVKRDDPIF